MVSSPTSSQIIQSQTMMLPHVCFTILLITRLRRGSSSLFQHHFFTIRPHIVEIIFIWEYDFPSLLLRPILILFCPFMPTMSVTIQNERLLLILLNANYSPWRFSALLILLGNDVIPLEDSFHIYLSIYPSIYICLYQLCQVAIISHQVCLGALTFH